MGSAPGRRARETKPLNNDVFVDVGENEEIVVIKIWSLNDDNRTPNKTNN